ncbi:MAG: hypothetical protein NT041_00115, partial [Candidatus Vogelbacteria bacterium]|nr:hypothetical protein [Candidatus Vogelbacteria bacterium]
ITYDLNQQILMKIRRDLEELSQVQDEPARGPASGNLRTVFEPAKAEAVMPTVGQAPQPNPSTPQIFNDKMTNVANVPKQGVAIRDPYKESI